MNVSRLAGIFFALSGFVLSGCGGSVSSLCGEICDCTGCSEKEEEDCVDNAEDTQKAADDEGCSDQFDAVLSCYNDQLECRDSEIDLDGCDSEEKELSKCAGGSIGGIGTNVCQRAVSLCAEEAGGGEGGAVDCSGVTQCVSECVVAANTCDFADEGLVDCYSDCTGDDF